MWHKKLFIEPHIKVSRIVSQYFLPQPRYILPVSKAASNDDDDDDEVLLDKASTIEQPYGPITAEEVNVTRNLKLDLNCFLQLNNLLLFNY